MNIQNIINRSIEVLGIQKPVRIQFLTAPSGLAGDNQYLADSDIVRSKRGRRANTPLNRVSNIKPILHHKIRVYLFNLSETDNLNALVIHELIHAWQWENTPGFNKPGVTEYHGEEFAEWADILGPEFGISPTSIYRPDVDNY